MPAGGHPGRLQGRRRRLGATAAPADTLERGPWWELFDDPVLNGLAAQVEVSNQNVAAAVAAYDQARAITREQRAALFPQVSLDGGRNRTGGPATRPTTHSYRVNIGASWEPDVFGRLRNGGGERARRRAGRAGRPGRRRLAAQGELAANYFAVRQVDIATALQAATVAGYQRSLQIARNRYDAGVVARTDVLQAESQLANAPGRPAGAGAPARQLRACGGGAGGQGAGQLRAGRRSAVERAIPAIPPEVPSTLLQRRPDIAAAERLVAQANAQIGIARAGYFPSFNLTGSIGSRRPASATCSARPALVWAVGSSLAQMIFDAGATSARVDQARAAHAGPRRATARPCSPPSRTWRTS